MFENVAKIIFIENFLCIKDSISLSKASTNIRKSFRSCQLFKWLEELFILEFDHNGDFYIHSYSLDFRCRNRNLDQLDVLHHGVPAGVSFVMSRKSLLCKKNILITFYCHKCNDKKCLNIECKWFDDLVFRQNKLVSLPYQLRFNRFENLEIHKEYLMRARKALNQFAKRNLKK